MYSPSSLGNESKQFIESFSFNNKGRNIITSLVLGKIFADRASIPSSPINKSSVAGSIISFSADDETTATSFYRVTFELPMNKILDALNELVVIDYSTIRDFAYSFYSAKYNIVYPSSGLFLSSEETAVSDFFSISKSVSKDVLELIKHNRLEISSLYNSFTKIINSIENGE